MTVTGRCLCGAIAFAIAGPLTPAHACHCRMCRRQSGHYVVATGAPRAAVIITGTEHLSWYRSSDHARRGFCRTCGSVLFWDDGGDELSLNAGCLDPPTGVTLTKHIFVDERGDYYAITDDLPRFAGYDRPLDQG